MPKQFVTLALCGLAVGGALLFLSNCTAEAIGLFVIIYIVLALVSPRKRPR